VFSFTSSQGAQAQWPYLDVTLLQRFGDEPYFTLERFPLSDRSSASVNVANGNLLVRATDLRLAGAGLDFVMERHYNSQWRGDGYGGEGWTTSLAGTDLGLWGQPNGDWVFFQEGKASLLFEKLSGGEYKSPRGANARLCQVGVAPNCTGDSNDGYVLVFNESRTRYGFWPNGGLNSITDRNGNAISFSHPAPSYDLASVTDTQGRTISITSEDDHRITSMTDSSVGRSWGYSYTDELLRTYTDPAGKQTLYGYDGSERLLKITDPNGQITKFGYDSRRRVTSIKRVTDVVADTGPTCTFAYEQPTAQTGCPSDRGTIETDPNGNKTKYCYDRQLQVTKAIDANGHARSRTYTANGDVNQYTSASAQALDLSFDNETDNRLETVRQPSGDCAGGVHRLCTRFSYDTNTANRNSSASYHSPLTAKDEQGRTTSFGYDTAGNLNMVRNELQSQNQLDLNYNPNGTLHGVWSSSVGTGELHSDFQDVWDIFHKTTGGRLIRNCVIGGAGGRSLARQPRSARNSRCSAARSSRLPGKGDEG
jgi:YD repeat-containing protein